MEKVPVNPNTTVLSGTDLRDWRGEKKARIKDLARECKMFLGM